MAQANGVPVRKVCEFEASRRTTKVSANVSGIFGTTAVRLNDSRLLARYGAGWGLDATLGVGDVASLPLFAALFPVHIFIATPLQHTLIRSQEVEADRFGLHLSREPHGMAEAFLKLSEYRKPDPGALEEFVFFDHPSAKQRIHGAMQWREAMGTP